MNPVVSPVPPVVSSPLVPTVVSVIVPEGSVTPLESVAFAPVVGSPEGSIVPLPVGSDAVGGAVVVVIAPDGSEDVDVDAASVAGEVIACEPSPHPSTSAHDAANHHRIFNCIDPLDSTSRRISRTNNNF
jgi:hypothetical protein